MPKTERYYSQQYSLVEPDPASHDGDFDHYADHSYSHDRFQSPPLSDDHLPLKSPPSLWVRRKKLIIFGAVAAALCIAVAIAVGVAVPLTKKDSFHYEPSDTQVTNTAAFTNGGATHESPDNTDDGVGAGKDEYVYYSGDWTKFPKPSAWVSFGDMWQGNLHSIQNSCELLGQGENNSPQDIQDIYDAIQDRAKASLVDHRFILAIIMQESHGCVRVKGTESSTGVKNPGLMQSHHGDSYSPSHSKDSIFAMVQDGTQGTDKGEGLAQNLDYYSNAYSAARGYNSGYIPKSGNLSEAAGATACYASDIANRLTGWVNATTKCTES